MQIVAVLKEVATDPEQQANALRLKLTIPAGWNAQPLRRLSPLLLKQYVKKQGGSAALEVVRLSTGEDDFALDLDAIIGEELNDGDEVRARIVRLPDDLPPPIEKGALAPPPVQLSLDHVGMDKPSVPAPVLAVQGGLLSALNDTDAMAGVVRSFADNDYAVLPLGVKPEVYAELRKEAKAAWPVMAPGLIVGKDGAVVEGMSPSGAARGDRFVLTHKLLETQKAPTLELLDTVLTKVGEALGPAILADPKLRLQLAGRSDSMLATFPGRGALYGNHYDGGGADARKITAILYLNEGWTVEDGGQLLMYDTADESKWNSVLPVADTLVLFRSDKVLHKVAAAHAERHAVTMFFYATQLDEASAVKAIAAAAGEEGGGAVFNTPPA